MKIQKPAVAGTLESSDAQVTVEPGEGSLELDLSSSVMNAQKPGLIKDAYIYGCDSIMLDLEDAVAENQKDAARFSLYHALKSVDYGDTEVIVRINGLDTPHWQEDVRVCVAGGADGIRIAKCERRGGRHPHRQVRERPRREGGGGRCGCRRGGVRRGAGPHPPHGRPGEPQGDFERL